MESPSSLHSVLQWACRDQTLADRYRRVLDVEGVQSIEDLSELTLDDMKEAGIKEVHAKKLERKCKKTKIKIAVGTKENVVGIIQVPCGMKLADVRRVIARDQLPEVPGSFQFRMDEMAVITEAQEGTWDAEVFTGDSVCILVPQKGNKGTSYSSLPDGKRTTYSSSLSSQPQPRDSTHRVAPQPLHQTHNSGLSRSINQQPSRKMPPNSQSVFTEPLPAASSTLPPLEDLQPLIQTSSSSHLSTKDLVNRSQVRAREAQSDMREVETGKRLLGQVVRNTDRTRPPHYKSSRTQVYIGGLTSYKDYGSYKIKDIDLANMFLYKYGHVQEYNRKAPSYAFVSYTYPESAKTCIAELNGLEFQQRFKFVCRYATKHLDGKGDDKGFVPFTGGKIRLNGVSYDMESKAIMRTFKRYGMVVNIVLSPSRQKGFVMFEERQAAEKAMQDFGQFVDVRGRRIWLSLKEENDDESSEDDGEEDGWDREWETDGDGDGDGEGGVGFVEVGEKRETQHRDSGVTTMEGVIESYINGAPAYTVRMKLRNLVSAKKDMELLCSLLLQNGIQRPGQIASCCRELVESQFELRDVEFSFFTFKTTLLGQCQRKLIHLLDSGGANKANELKGLMSFLAHLYNERVITSSVVFGCANRVLDCATPEFVVSVQHLLGAAERNLQRDDEEKTGNLKRRVMECKQNLANGAPMNPPNNGTAMSSASTSGQQRDVTSKQQLGNELYQKIYLNHPAMAAKITGMLLHSLDEQLLCHLLMSPPDLKRKVAEAVKVIGQYAPDK